MTDSSLLLRFHSKDRVYCIWTFCCSILGRHKLCLNLNDGYAEDSQQSSPLLSIIHRPKAPKFCHRLRESPKRSLLGERTLSEYS